MRERLSPARRAAYRAIPLLALVPIVIAALGCTSMTLALAGKPEPYAGGLRPGQLVRAIIEDYSSSFVGLAAARRTSRDEQAIEPVSFTNAPKFRPAAGGTMVVFRVLNSWNYHTPDDASGMHEWISVFDGDLIAVEMNEDDAIAAARACLEASADRGSYNLGDPFAFGPGARGGWVVRFESRAEQGAAASIDFEVDRKGGCEIVRPPVA